MPGVVMAVMHWSVEVMLEWPQVGQERRMRMHIVGLVMFWCFGVLVFGVWCLVLPLELLLLLLLLWSLVLIVSVGGGGGTDEQTNTAEI